ncbi:MAG: HDOD domain-containing protein [Polyangiaceae bacterium]|nr:HDOD domain-containing protein [Polyangiaceae bacterium]
MRPAASLATNHTYLARQAVFDARQRAVAYELLYRSGPENFFPAGVDGALASTRLMHDSLNLFGLESLGGGKKLLINVTREVLLGGLIRAMPPELVGIELLETVEPAPDVVAACRALKDEGYTLALDDFSMRPGYEPLVRLADIIKVDFRATVDESERAAAAELGHRHGAQLLAEKVETREEFAEAQRLGYMLYQGYFFCRPEMSSVRQLPAFKLNYVRLFQVANDPHLDLGEVEQLIKRELSLSVKLLRYLNSAAFGLRGRVSSLRHAVVLLGEVRFRRWVSLLAVTGLGDGGPEELVTARFGEELARAAGLDALAEDTFLCGLLSCVDALLGCPLRESLDSLAIDGAVSEALLEGRGPTGPPSAPSPAASRSASSC